MMTLRKWLRQHINGLKAEGTISQIKLGKLVGVLKYFPLSVLFAPLDISAAQFIRFEIFPSVAQSEEDNSGMDVLHVDGQIVYCYNVVDYAIDGTTYTVLVNMPISVYWPSTIVRSFETKYCSFVYRIDHTGS